MRRYLQQVLAFFAFAFLAVGSSTLVAATPAQAFGNETFGCRVTPGTDTIWRTTCSNTVPASSYNVRFAVLNQSGGGYTYSWNISGTYHQVSSGCTSTSSSCVVTVSNNQDHFINATVTYRKDGQSATRHAEAFTLMYCGDHLC